MRSYRRFCIFGRTQFSKLRPPVGHNVQEIRRNAIPRTAFEPIDEPFAPPARSLRTGQRRGISLTIGVCPWAFQHEAEELRWRRSGF